MEFDFLIDSSPAQPAAIPQVRRTDSQNLINLDSTWSSTGTVPTLASKLTPICTPVQLFRSRGAGIVLIVLLGWSMSWPPSALHVTYKINNSRLRFQEDSCGSCLGSYQSYSFGACLPQARPNRSSA